jgi:hypothetical protein
MCRRGSGLWASIQRGACTAAATLVALGSLSPAGAAAAAGVSAKPTSASAKPASASPPTSASKATLVLPSSAEPQTIALAESGGQITGSLKLAVRNEGASKGTLSARFLPAGAGASASADAVKLVVPDAPIAAHELTELEIKAQLPAGSSPAGLSGFVQLQLLNGRKPIGEPLDVAVKGAGPAIDGVSIVPTKITLHSISWGGQFFQPDGDSTTVQLRGPGVPALFAGSNALSVGVKVQSSTGHQVEATLTAHAPAAGEFVADATVTVKGKLSPGSYATKVPLSDLTQGGPELELKLDSSHAFLWALLAVAVGAIVGGGIYLASNLKRRKGLLEASVRDTLDEYLEARTVLTEAAKPGAMPLWSVPRLGRHESWYERKWSALPEIDGVRGIWSKIYWARNEADLDDAEALVEKLLERVTRWLLVYKEGEIETLLSAFKAAPEQHATKQWDKTKTYADTRELLLELRELEPKTQEEAEALCERTVRQARWHSALALVWHMYGVINEKSKELTDSQRDVFETITLDEFVEAVTSEKERDAKKQLTLERELDEWREKLESIARELELDLPDLPAAPVVAKVGAMSAEELRPGSSTAPSLASVTPDPLAEKRTRESNKYAAAHAVVDDWRKANPKWLRALIRRDALWSLLIVVVSAAAYVPSFYSSTWGSLGDYGSAFVAGFLGKMVVNWGILPIFTSLSLKATKSAEDPKKQEQDGERQDGTAKTSAPNPKGSPAAQQATPTTAPAGDSAAQQPAPGSAGAEPGAALS